MLSKPIRKLVRTVCLAILQLLVTRISITGDLNRADRIAGCRKSRFYAGGVAATATSDSSALRAAAWATEALSRP
jgi:hypothetical protein